MRDKSNPGSSRITVKSFHVLQPPELVDNLILIQKFVFMIYCSKGDSYRVVHVTTDASDLQIGFHIFFALKAILSSIGYNLQNPADTTIGHIPH